jgi:hypothetical protein
MDKIREVAVIVGSRRPTRKNDRQEKKTISPSWDKRLMATTSTRNASANGQR